MHGLRNGAGKSAMLYIRGDRVGLRGLYSPFLVVLKEGGDVGRSAYILYSASILLYAFGITLALLSAKYKTDKAPRFPIWDVRQWRPVWRAREWFAPKGYRLCLVGFVTGCISTVLLVTAIILN